MDRSAHVVATREAAGPSYIVPARTFRGSRREMLADLDEAIRALLALRLVILDEAPRLQSPSALKR